MTVKTKKYFIIALIVFLMFWGCEELFRRKIGGFAGSYPYVEYWEIDAPEAEVLKAIVELKNANPYLQPPGQKELFFPRTVEYDWETEEMKKHLELSLKDSTLALPPMTKSNTITDYWLYIDFFYADTKEIVHTWTRPAVDTTFTTFAFVSLSKVHKPKERRLINRDFWYIANKLQIHKFEKTFVEKIKQQIEKNRKRGV